jgi:hypothetical protein
MDILNRTKIDKERLEDVLHYNPNEIWTVYAAHETLTIHVTKRKYKLNLSKVR